MQVKPSTATYTIEVKCSEERRVVGHLEVTGGSQVVLTWGFILGNFTPEGEEYRLNPTAPPTGSMLFCPRCKSHLTIAGTLHSDEQPDSRANVDQSQVRKDFDVDAIPIVIDRTKFTVKV